MERPLGIMLYREEKKDISYTELKTIADNTFCNKSAAYYIKSIYMNDT